MTSASNSSSNINWSPPNYPSSNENEVSNFLKDKEEGDYVIWKPDDKTDDKIVKLSYVFLDIRNGDEARIKHLDFSVEKYGYFYKNKFGNIKRLKATKDWNKSTDEPMMLFIKSRENADESLETQLTLPSKKDSDKTDKATPDSATGTDTSLVDKKDKGDEKSNTAGSTG